MPSSQKKRSCAARSHSREPVLITESGRKYAAFRKQLNSELQPGGVMMRALVGDLAALAWDDERLIRWKADILNGAFCEALQNVLRRVWSDDFESHAERERTIEDLAWQWLRNDASAKARVAELLAQHQLNHTAIETEALRLRAAEVDQLNRLLLMNAVHREKSVKLFGILGEARLVDAQPVKSVNEQASEAAQVPHVVARFKRGG